MTASARTAVTPAPPPDEAQRRRITSDLDATLFVEAGAGAGKTSSLVARIVNLVRSGVPITGIAAITFTEKAAAELRSRTRQRLEADPGPATDAALARLDHAPIGTLHSFARRILFDFPIEAGLPPGFAVLDELESGLAFEEQWGDLLDRLLDEADPADGLIAGGRAFVELCEFDGFGVDKGARRIADDFRSNWDLVSDRVELSDPGPLRFDTTAITALADSIASTPVPADDTQAGIVAELVGLASGLVSDSLRTRLEALAALDDKCGKWGERKSLPGAKGKWTSAFGKEGGEALEALRADEVELGRLANEALESVNRHRRLLLGAIIGRFVLDTATERAATGQLEFHDLLVLARRLLTEHPYIRRALHERYERVLLDEFQDTDPIQLEVAVRLTADPDDPAQAVVEPSAATDQPTDQPTDQLTWRDLRPLPGRLFIVGDPKQSIYRFRRADIATYLEQQDLSIAADAESVVALTTNFRSTTPVLAWVNDVFGQLIVAEEHAQPAYVPLLVAPDRPEWSDGLGPAVSVLGTTAEDEEALAEAKAPQVREREARDIAAMILRAIGEGNEPAWQKEAPGSGGFARSPVELKDICILIPSRTSLSALEEALTSANIEFTAEASSLVYSTQEIHDLLLALRALANTADEAALALTLRTPLFGVSDDELLVWKSGLGRWGLYSQIPEDLESHPIADALLYLRELHGDLGVLAPADLLSRLVSDRRMLEAVTDSPRYRDVWRRIRFVIDQAQAWSDATHGSLREYLVWARAQQEDNARVIEAIVPETGMNAVRITTIHMSKGREFPVVVVGGSSTSPRASSQPVLWLDDQPVVRLIKGVANAAHEGAAAIEKAFDEAERTRLLYVACTRAESHLVVSLYQGTKPCPGRQLREVHNESLSDQPVLEHGRRITGEPPVTAVGALPDWAMWELERAAWRDASAIPASMPVTVLAKGKSTVARLPLGTVTYVDAEDLAFPAFLGDDAQHGTELGIAVHRVLELSDLRIDERLPQIATDVARAAGLPASTLEAMARSALLSEPVARASTRGHWLELPITGTSGGIVLEGVADLVYREDDGSLVVVDFKTDLGVREEAVDGYWRQLSAYAELISNATEESVSGLVLVYCRSAVAHVRRRRASNSFLSGV